MNKSTFIIEQVDNKLIISIQPNESETLFESDLPETAPMNSKEIAYWLQNNSAIHLEYIDDLIASIDYLVAYEVFKAKL